MVCPPTVRRDELKEVSAEEADEGEHATSILFELYKERYLAIKAAKSMVRVLSSMQVQCSNLSPWVVTSLLRMSIVSRVRA